MQFALLMDGRFDSARSDFSIRPAPKRFDRSDSTNLQGSGGVTDSKSLESRLTETGTIRFDTDGDSKPVAKGGRPSMLLHLY